MASKPINSEPTAFKTELAGLPNVGTVPATPVVKAVLKTLFSSKSKSFLESSLNSWEILCVAQSTITPPAPATAKVVKAVTATLAVESKIGTAIVAVEEDRTGDGSMSYCFSYKTIPKSY